MCGRCDGWGGGEQYYINANPKIIDYHLQKCGGEGVPVDMDKIHWTPHLSSDRWLR